MSALQSSVSTFPLSTSVVFGKISLDGVIADIYEHALSLTDKALGAQIRTTFLTRHIRLSHGSQ
jgi:hypothetical protein